MTIKERKRQLDARLVDLKVRLGAIAAELLAHDAADSEDLAIERESDEVLEGMGIKSQHEMAMIHAALARMANGEFGFCRTCGEAIGENRLNVLPYTPFCSACAV